MSLDRLIFSNKEYADYINKHYVSLKIKRAKGLPTDILEKYKIRGFPTTVLTETDGTEIARFFGFAEDAIDWYITNLKNYTQNIGTLTSLLEILKTDPNNSNALYKVARTYQDRGEEELSIEYFKKVISSDPKNENGRNVASNYHISIYNSKQSKTLQPLKDFIQSNSDKRYIKDAFNAMISSYSKERNYGEMLKLFEEALITHNIDDPYFINEYGWFVYEQRAKDHYDNAIKYVEIAVEKSPKDENIWDTLAWLYYETGDLNKAHYCMEKGYIVSSRDIFKKNMEKFRSEMIVN